MIVAAIAHAAGGSRITVSPARLIVDAKAAIGMGATANTAYGPQMNDRLRSFASGRGIAEADLPARSSAAQWRSGPVLPASVVRLLLWSAYASGMPLTSVSIESAASVPRWGIAASGPRTPPVREPLTQTGAANRAPPPAPERATETPPPSPAPERATETPPPSPAPERTPSTSNAAGGCVATMPSAWHLRETETAASQGRAYPAGTEVQLLRRVGGITRGASERFFRVRVVADQREGFAFVPTSSLPACAPTIAGDVVAGAIGAGADATMKLVGKIVVGVVGTGLALSVVGAVIRRRRRLALNASTPQRKS